MSFFSITSNVRSITLDNFSSSGNLLVGGDKVLVVFFAEWCGYCHMLKPIVEELSKRVSVMAVNLSSGTTPEMSSWKFNVKGFPTVIGYVSGKPQSIYMGDRTLKDLEL